jgi:multidrug transporter EmrE-like cation transporter
MIWALMSIVVVLNTVAQSLFKMGAGKGLINRSLVGGVAAYGLSTVIYVLVLGRANLSFVYPIVIGSTVVVTCLVSTRVFGESMETLQWLGVALIIAGIACIAALRRSTAG